MKMIKILILITALGIQFAWAANECRREKMFVGGSVPGNKYIEGATSEQDCIESCKRMAACNAVNYWPEYHRCLPQTETLITHPDLQYREDPDTVYIITRGCNDQPTYPPLPKPDPKPKPEQGSFPEEDNILVLGASNFDAGVRSNRYVFVDFYSPYCGYCIALAPEFAKLAQRLKSEGSKIRLAKVDCPANMPLIRYVSRGFPTLKLFDNGQEVKEYLGQRTADSMLQWLKSAAPDVDPNPEPEITPKPVAPTNIPEQNGVLIVTANTFDQVKIDQVVFVDFYTPWCGYCKRLAPEFDKSAQDLNSQNSAIRLAKVNCDEEQSLCGRYVKRGYPTLILFANGREIEYNGPRMADSMVQWVKSASHQ